MKILQSLVVCEEYGAAEKFFPDFSAPRVLCGTNVCTSIKPPAKRKSLRGGDICVCEDLLV